MSKSKNIDVGVSRLQYDPRKGNYLLENTPVFVIPCESTLSVFNDLETYFGGGAHVISYRAGQNFGSKAAGPLSTRMEKQEIFKRFADNGSRWGLGSYKLVELIEDKFRLVFELSNIPLFKTAAKLGVFMFFLKGFYTSFFETVLGVTVKIEYELLSDKDAVQFRITESS